MEGQTHERLTYPEGNLAITRSLAEQMFLVLLNIGYYEKM
jgi:hypothetical protein